MAKGRQQHQDYLDALSLLGKDLARRARSKCELSGVSGSLKAFDLEDSSVDPDLDHVVLVCDEVHTLLGANKVDRPRDTLRYLEEAVWNTEVAVRRAAVRILEKLDEPWAREAIDNAKSMDAY